MFQLQWKPLNVITEGNWSNYPNDNNIKSTPHLFYFKKCRWAFAKLIIWTDLITLSDFHCTTMNSFLNTKNEYFLSSKSLYERNQVFDFLAKNFWNISFSDLSVNLFWTHLLLKRKRNFICRGISSLGLLIFFHKLQKEIQFSNLYKCLGKNWLCQTKDKKSFFYFAYLYSSDL